MGIHRRFEGSGGGGTGGEPVPLPPKGGRGQESCDGVSLIDLEFELMPTQNDSDARILKFLTMGCSIAMFSFDDWSGDNFPSGEGPEAAQESSGEVPTDAGYDTEPNPPRETGTNKDEDGPGQKNQIGPHTSSDPNELEKREEYEVKEIEKKVIGADLVRIKVKGQNAKEKLLERKINKRLGDHLTPTIKDAVESIITDIGFTEYYLDDIVTPMPLFDVGEYFAKDALDICALLSGAAYTVLDGAFHFFQTNSRPNPRPCSTDYRDLSASEIARYRNAKVNPIRKGTAKTLEDDTNMTNRVQEGNAGKKSEVTKLDVWPTLGSDEFHTTYQPLPPYTCYIVTGGELILLISPVFIRQDWGDRPEVEHYKNLGIPYPSPAYDGTLDPLSDYGVYVNIKEKAFRLVDAITGQPYYPAGQSYEAYFQVSYYHKDPVFSIIQDDESINQWGIRETIIVSPSQQYDELFKAIGKAMVRDYSQPLKSVECEVYDDIYRVGDYVRFHIPQVSFDEELCIFEVSRDFDAGKRKHYPQQDFGQSVRIRAGAKVPRNLRHVLEWMNNKIKEHDRLYSQSDLDSDSGFSVPREWVRMFEDEMEIRETVVFTKFIVGRIDEGRIDEAVTV